MTAVQLSPDQVKALADAVAARLAEHLVWPEVMELKTAARYIDVGYDTLLKMTQAREIPVVMRGSRKAIRRIDLDHWAKMNLI